jgi:hypothetical protein
MPDIACPVCHSMNAPTRMFCWKCAADLHAPVADPSAAPAPPKVVVPVQPILLGVGVAVAAIALIAVVVVLLSGSPAASISPSGGSGALPTSAVSTDGGAGSGSTAGAPSDALPTEPPVTEAPAATQAPKPTAAPATPEITPVPKPKIVSFQGPKSVNCADPAYSGFITLSWLIDNADSTELSVDGTGVYKSYPGAQGSDMVPFACGNGQHTYTLTTVGGEGPAATKTLTVVEDSGT